MTCADPYPSLHQTVHVAADGAITHGIEVPHEAANIPCGQVIGTWEAEGVRYPKRCRKRVGHNVAADEAPHVPVDYRINATPPHVAHTTRFAPGGIPAGVDQNAVTIPHDCANHLPDTEQVLRRGW